MSTGEGLIARFSRIAGVTPKGVLDSPLRLPAVLNNVSVEEEAQHSEYTTISAGQFSQGAQGGSVARMLRGLQLEALTLEWDADWLVESGQDPDAVRDELYAIERSHKAVQLMLVMRFGETPDLRMNVTLRNVVRELRPQENDTRYFTITIKEWRDPSVTRRSTQQGRKAGVKFPTTVALRAADTLLSLAHEYYGRYDVWRDIRDANGISKKFGQGTPLVQLARYKVGSKIKLPIVVLSSHPQAITKG